MDCGGIPVTYCFMISKTLQEPRRMFVGSEPRMHSALLITKNRDGVQCS